jgi:hypothetical protein
MSKISQTLTEGLIYSGVDKLLDFILPGSLGLVPAESRKVIPIPEELETLVPQPTDNNTTVKPGNPDPEKDTVPLMIDKIKRTAWQGKKLAAKLKGKTLEETLRNVSGFILKYIKYEKDDALNEQVRSLRRLVYDKKGDCDCFASAIGNLLWNLKIKFFIRITTYQRPTWYTFKTKSGDWAHVYIIVPKNQKDNRPVESRSDYYVLDPVTNKHDYEKPYADKKDFNMALQFLDGFPSSGSLSGLGCCDTKQAPAPGNGNGGVTVNINNSNEQQGVYAVSMKSLQDRGLEPAAEFLRKTGLPHKAMQTSDGVPYYAVQTPSGAVKQVPGIIPIAPAAQDQIKNELMTAPAPVTNTVTASVADITPGKAAVGVGIAILVIAALAKARAGSASAKGLGALSKKKLPVVQL